MAPALPFGDFRGLWSWSYRRDLDGPSRWCNTYLFSSPLTLYASSLYTGTWLVHWARLHSRLCRARWNKRPLHGGKKNKRNYDEIEKLITRHKYLPARKLRTDRDPWPLICRSHPSWKTGPCRVNSSMMPAANGCTRFGLISLYGYLQKGNSGYHVN